jgi:CRISPR-associated endonuclease/helicase Cas3
MQRVGRDAGYVPNCICLCPHSKHWSGLLDLVIALVGTFRVFRRGGDREYQAGSSGPRQQAKQRKEGASIAELAAALETHLEKMQAGAADTPVNQIRCAVLADCVAAAAWEPGLFSLTVPTGGGKTLAGLIFALKHAQLYGMERVIVAVPFISIIEQTAEIYRVVFDAFPGSVVEHHSLTDYDSAHLSISLATENWAGSILVTTAPQFYDSLYANRPSKCRKLHNIARSVVILDEDQTLPVGLLAP